MCDAFCRDEYIRLSPLMRQLLQKAEAEKGMDLANNQKGIYSAKKLLEENRYSEESLMQSFLEDLKNKKIVVLSPRKAKTP